MSAQPSSTPHFFFWCSNACIFFFLKARICAGRGRSNGQKKHKDGLACTVTLQNCFMERTYSANAKAKPLFHQQLVHVSTQFSSLSHTPAQKQSLVIDISTVQNMALGLPTIIAKCQNRRHSHCWLWVNINTKRLFLMSSVKGHYNYCCFGVTLTKPCWTPQFSLTSSIIL